MAAFGTKKPGGDVGVQLTFPTVFENTFAAFEPGNIAYANSVRPAPKFLPAGDDLQALYHEQKRIDAHRRALNAVRDTAASHYRANHGHAGYYGLPPVVLSQRRFANPSNGSGGLGGDIYSARRDASDAPFHCVKTGGMRGGVLRSAQGQRYGVAKLRDRIRQLNNIDQAESAFKTLSVAEQAAAPVMIEERVTQGFEAPSGLALEVFSLLDAIEDSVTVYRGNDIDRLAGKQGSDFTKLLLRFGSTANREQLEALLEQLEIIVRGRESLLADWIRDADYEGLDEDEEVPRGMMGRRFETRFPFFTRLASSLIKSYLYTRAMLVKVNSTAAERRRASEVTARTLGMDSPRMGEEVKRFFDLNLLAEPEVLEEFAPESFFTPNVVAEPPPETRGRGRGRPRGGARPRASRAAVPSRPTGMSDRFTPNAPTREDTLAREYGMKNARFDRDVRQAFGDRSGAYLGDPFPGSTPAEMPRNGMRKAKVEAARLPVAEPVQAAPAMPDLPDAPVAEAAAQEGMGKRKGRGRKPKLPTKTKGGFIPLVTAAARILPLLLGNGQSLTRASLPKDREGFVALAEELRGKGHPIRVNKNSSLKSIRANFIRKFKL
ncbi:hypothetical protein EBZ39_05075 [bacterium]|nr:hypothetical protein [bacterium]